MELTRDNTPRRTCGRAEEVLRAGFPSRGWGTLRLLFRTERPIAHFNGKLLPID
jgi:hypothetical protein